jgi:hypothetical protein
MTKRQVWVVEYRGRRGGWVVQVSESTRKEAVEYLAEFRRANPMLTTRIVPYAPVAPDTDEAAPLRHGNKRPFQPWSKRPKAKHASIQAGGKTT